MKTVYLKNLNDAGRVTSYVKCFGHKSIEIYPIGRIVNRFTSFTVEDYYGSGCIESTEAEFIKAQLDMINYITAPL